jgi:cobalt/nickel transport system ATP-binding protein
MGEMNDGVNRGMGVPPMSSTGVPPVSSQFPAVSSLAQQEQQQRHGQDAHVTHGQDGHATHGQDARATPVLRVTDLGVCYHDGTRALSGVSFAIAPGERAALIGPNGAGKTSLMLAIMNGVHWSGAITVDGVALSRRSAGDARSCCGMIFQDADDQLFMPTLLEDVVFGPLNQGLSAPDATARATGAIASVGLDGLEHKSAHHLSGGQKRAAALATILSMQVKLLLLDEPGANLDFRSRRRLIDLLCARSEAMLLATHDLDMVRKLATRVIVLDAGKLAADAPMSEILDNPRLLAEHGLA